MNNYKECVSRNSVTKCEREWDSFTQYYWPHSFTDSYENISGFERYQITIDSDTVLQPSFIANDQLMAGTHYIIGGGFEDQWGFGCLIETFGRKYVPQLFDNIIPFYSFIRSLLRDIFNNLDWFNRKLVYVERLSTNEMTALTELYSQFNFSHESLFTIGHSISGSAQKGVSYYTDINGIVFDSSIGENMGDFETAVGFERSFETINQITNVYSDGCYLTGIDDDCLVNGVLPRRYYNPSVYDSACLTVIACSETNKYVHYCKQVLTQNSRDPIEEFQKSMNAYYEHYGIQVE